jgi:type VI secretion system ImpM family protein
MSGPAAATAQADRAQPAAAGWFGKIPALGDFAGRRLPPQFIESWDAWLSAELAAARQVLGTEWPHSHLDAPIWRFALTPGVLDSRRWFGILMASTDRVGRWFPLSLAASAEQAFAGLEVWWEELARAALKSREPGCDAEALDQAVLAAVPCLEPAGRTALPPESARADLAVAAPATSLWWTCSDDGTATGEPWTVNGLPRGEHFQRLWRPA